ncbi:MAG: DHA2 family efflux MFS transporter permease subunit [Mycobacterium sp.]
MKGRRRKRSTDANEMSTGGKKSDGKGNLFALLFVLLALFIIEFDITVVNIALPRFSKDLSASATSLEWIVDAYTLPFTGLLLLAGYLGDRFGRRLILCVGLVGFATTSALSGLSQTTGELIASRTAMGVCAALVFPATLAIINVLFTDARERTKAMALWGATIGAAIAAGPLVGGLLLEHHGWQSLFWINVPLALVAFVGAVVQLPESAAKYVDPVDAVGIVLSVVAITSVVWGIIEAPRRGWTSYSTVVGILVGAVLLLAFMVWEKRSAYPIFNVDLFANVRFSVCCFTISVCYFLILGLVFLVVQYLQIIKGYTALQAGVRTLPFSSAIILFSPMAVVASRRAGLRAISLAIGIGLPLLGVGMVLTYFARVDSSYLQFVLPGMILAGAGVAIAQTPATEEIMNSLPPDKAGAGSAINDVTRQFGGTLGVAILGSTQATMYSDKLNSRLVDLGIPDDLRRRGESSIVAGIELVGQLPGKLHRAVIEAARDSFTEGFNVTSSIGGAIAFVATAIALLALRRSGREAGDGIPPWDGQRQAPTTHSADKVGTSEGS